MTSKAMAAIVRANFSNDTRPQGEAFIAVRKIQLHYDATEREDEAEAPRARSEAVDVPAEAVAVEPPLGGVDAC